MHVRSLNVVRDALNGLQIDTETQGVPFDLFRNFTYSCHECLN